MLACLWCAISRLNRSTSLRLSLAPRAWEGKTAQQLLGERLYALARPAMERALRGETSVDEWRDDDPDHRAAPRYFEVSYAPLMGENGQPIGAYGVGRDITDTKEEQMRLLKASNTDALTELLNRAGFPVRSRSPCNGPATVANWWPCSISTWTASSR